MFLDVYVLSGVDAIIFCTRFHFMDVAWVVGTILFHAMVVIDEANVGIGYFTVTNMYSHMVCLLTRSK